MSEEDIQKAMHMLTFLSSEENDDLSFNKTPIDMIQLIGLRRNYHEDKNR
ncbi:MAG: hypothetical protein ACLFPM_04635 [Candidatus Izemoplasmatales bacterium]